MLHNEQDTPDIWEQVNAWGWGCMPLIAHKYLKRGRDKDVYHVILCHLNKNQSSMNYLQCNPSLKRIGLILNMTESHVSRSVKRICETPLMSVGPRYGRRNYEFPIEIISPNKRSVEPKTVTTGGKSLLPHVDSKLTTRGFEGLPPVVTEQTSGLEQTKERVRESERERNGRVDARENAPFFLEDEHQCEDEEKQNAQVTTETQQPVAPRPSPPTKAKPTPTPQPTPDIQPPSMPGKDSHQHLMHVFEGIIWPIAIFCNHVTPGRSKKSESIARFLHHCRTLADAERLAESYDALKRCNEANDALHVMPGLQVFIGRKDQRPDWKTQDIVAQCSKATRTAQRRHVRLPDWQDNEGWEKLGRSVGVHADSYESWNTFKYDVKDAVRA